MILGDTMTDTDTPEGVDTVIAWAATTPEERWEEGLYGFHAAEERITHPDRTADQLDGILRTYRRDRGLSEAGAIALRAAYRQEYGR